MSCKLLIVTTSGPNEEAQTTQVAEFRTRREVDDAVDQLREANGRGAIFHKCVCLFGPEVAS